MLQVKDEDVLVLSGKMMVIDIENGRVSDPLEDPFDDVDVDTFIKNLSSDLSDISGDD